VCPTLDDEEYGPVITDQTMATPCDAGVHVLCCHECTCDCHEADE
jgi:hypothetical protein